MARYIVQPESSRVWIDGSSSLHPIKSDASGLIGSVEFVSAGGRDPQELLLGGEIRIAVDRLKSGNALVDRETRRRVKADKYPEIVGTVREIEAVGDGRFAVVGTIEFRGEERDVSGELTVSQVGDRIVIEGEQSFDVRDWGFTPPKIGLLRVHPDVHVRISVSAVTTPS